MLSFFNGTVLATKLMYHCMRWEDGYIQPLS